jgi:hypothetical protein
MGGTNRRIHELQSLFDVPPTTVSSLLSVSTLSLLVAAVLIEVIDLLLFREGRVNRLRAGDGRGIHDALSRPPVTASNLLSESGRSAATFEVSLVLRITRPS